MDFYEFNDPNGAMGTNCRPDCSSPNPSRPISEQAQRARYQSGRGVNMRGKFRQKKTPGGFPPGV